MAVGAAFFLAAAVVVPGLLLPLNRLWRGFAQRLGKVNNFVVLGLFYYLLMLPLGIIIRLLGRDTMSRRRRRGEKSYWSPVKRDATPDNFSDMF